MMSVVGFAIAATVLNESGDRCNAVQPGETVEVIDREGLTLLVKPLSQPH